MTNVDLDQGGRRPQNVRTYLGPSMGWKQTDSPVDIEYAFEGGGGIILPGAKPPILIPDWLTIFGWVLLSSASCSATVDVWKVTLDQYLAGTIPSVANSITGTEIPTLTGSAAAGSTTLAGWTKRINQNDVLAFSIDGNASSCTLILRCIRDLGPT